jgi:type IV pilus assembly protein PilQ
MISLGNVGLLYGQDEYPREFTNPDEIVAFDRSTSYQEAIEVLNQFYQEYRNKFIVDQTNTAGEIGVSLPAMHWEDALEFILRLKNLALVEEQDYVEIVTQSSLVPVEEVSSGGSQADGGINLNTREVRINATFFEGNRRALQEIGVDWSTLRGVVPQELNAIVAGEGANPEDGLPNSTFTDQFVAVNSFNAASVSQNVFNALVNFGPFGEGENAISVQALFSAFEADNLGELLATPFTKVVDGQEGRVQVGQDFSIKQRDIAGNVTDQFFSTGTILSVTPTVIEINDTSFIHLDIEVERSTAQPDVVSTIINKQQASKQALLLDGEATAIAGLYRSEEATVRRGIPILKDLPPWFFGLRYLFGFNSDDIVENELVIIVQASLEKTIEERAAAAQFASKSELLDYERVSMRSGLDAVFENNLFDESASMDEILAEEIVEEDDPIDETTDSTEAEEEEPEEVAADDASVDTEDPSDALEMTMDDEELVEDPITENVPEELTEEQQQLAEELSLPVDNPELMVVVPRAFSLNEYLTKKENGDEELEMDEEVSELKYFVIGGSFIVKNNANRFFDGLTDQGYETQVLFHPESRFNFVAYQGFVNFEDAVDYLMEIRGSINSEAWLFTLPTE